MPFSIFFGYAALLDKDIPSINGTFALWVVVAALSQIAGQFLLVYLFSFRNFTVGTAYSRTEPAQAALFAFVVFSETLSASTIIAICVAVLGVMLISVARTAFPCEAC